MRYICWTFVSGYNLLKEAVTGHLLWQHSGETCVWRRIVVSESLLNLRRWIMEEWESGALCFQYNNITFYTRSSLFLWFRNQICDAPPKIRFQSVVKALPTQCDSTVYS